MILRKSKFVLGTVQLGLKYGVNNTRKQPTRKEAFLILDAALAAGINTFDTAYAYGAAEDVLGAWIKDRSLADKIYVVSKMRPYALNGYPDGTKAVDIVMLELEKSLKRLCLESLDGYLFHTPHYIYSRYAMEGLRKAKDAGMVKNIGVSIYNEDEALQAAEIGVDYAQVPYNIFDQRLSATNFFELAKKNKVTIFIRSPFLQGLLLMRPNRLPKHLSFFGPFLKRFAGIIKRYHLSPKEASLLFVQNHCPSSHIVFGVDAIAHLREDVAIIKNLPVVNEDWMREIEDCFKNFNHLVVNPSLWNKIKQNY